MDQAQKDDIMAAIHNFLKQNFPLMQKHEVKPDDMLLEIGVLDSLGLLVLVEHIETNYGIRVSVEDMVVENFGSIAAITNFIARQRVALPHAKPDAAAYTDD